MKMFKIYVEKNDEVEVKTVVEESLNSATRHANKEYGKENILKVTDVTEKLVYKNASIDLLIDDIYNLIISNNLSDVEYDENTAYFIKQVLKKALNN